MRIEGTLFFSGQGKYRIEIATDVPSVARLIIKLLHELYHLETNLTVRRSVLHKTPNYLIEAPSQPRLAPALVDMGVLSPDGGLELGLKPDLVEKQCCTAAYLRGAFLGSGFVSDPRGDFHLEIAVQGEAFANQLADLIGELGVHARVNPRRGAFAVYVKSAEDIYRLLRVLGAPRACAEIEEARAVKSVKNEVNRRVNAELANQGRSAGAARKQLELIWELERLGVRAKLPEALETFCALRERHPDLSLRDLGQMADPPLSKSALYHRVLRLEKMVAETRERS